MTKTPYRLPDDTAINRVVLEIADLARSIDYYVRVIGFELRSRDAGSATLGAHGGGELLALRERPGALVMPDRGRLGLYHFAILLPDRAALGRFVAHLAMLGARVGSADHLVSEATYLRDPDGLGIEVYVDRPRESWRRVNGEIAMDTRPLDLAELIRSGNSEPWRGLPAGTRVGHVHLHVADIDRAREFYSAALGLEPVVWSYPGALFLSAGGYHHHLGLNTWAGRDAESPREGHARLAEWEIVVPSDERVREAVANLRGAGATVSEGDGEWRVADPWGTTLALRAARR